MSQGEHRWFGGFPGRRFGKVDLNGWIVDDVGGEHENDQEHQHDIDQWRNVDATDDVFVIDICTAGHA